RVEPGAFRLERILPAPGPALIVNLYENETRVYADDAERRCARTAGTAFSGQSTRSFLIDTREQIAVMGVVFRPGGGACFLREPMERLCDRHTALADLAGPAADALRERLLNTPDAAARLAVLEAWLRARFVVDALHPALARALAALERAPCVERAGGLIAASGYSARHFGTLFRSQVGVGPKRFARLRRFRAALAHVRHGEAVDWARVAADCGFHDQPHLVREFREFAGTTPARYVAARGDGVNYVPLT
ncbi:MAG TPA: helix-turn-helix domain-containing protein, partial [Dokdonella sp.]